MRASLSFCVRVWYTPTRRSLARSLTQSVSQSLSQRWSSARNKVLFFIIPFPHFVRYKLNGALLARHVFSESDNTLETRTNRPCLQCFTPPPQKKKYLEIRHLRSLKKNNNAVLNETVLRYIKRRIPSLHILNESMKVRDGQSAAQVAQLRCAL